jgi:hypothetical protein
VAKFTYLVMGGTNQSWSLKGSDDGAL